MESKRFFFVAQLSFKKDGFCWEGNSGSLKNFQPKLHALFSGENLSGLP